MRVLVIDDDAGVCGAMERMLDGFEVTFAQSAAGALGRIEAGARFATILCDVRMPGMDGVDFFDAVVKIDPGIARRIVYMSGAAADGETDDFLTLTGCAFIQKPFRAEELRAIVDAAARR